MTPREESRMYRAIRRLITQEGLTGEDADIAYEQWERAGYAAVMDTRRHGYPQLWRPQG